MEVDGLRKRRNEGDGSTHIVFRVCVPSAKIGPIIGKEGSNIKELREETRARIKITSPANKGDDRVVTVSSEESHGVGDQSPAEKAFMKIYPKAIEEVSPEADSSGTLRLLIAASQAGAVIGRGGSAIKNVRESSGANVRITENSTAIGAPADRVCQITGKVTAIHSAVASILSILSANPVTESLEDLESAGPAQLQSAAAAAAAAYATQQNAAASMMAPGWAYGAPSPPIGLAGGLAAAGFEDPLRGLSGPPMVMPAMVAQTLHAEMRVPVAAVGAILGRGGTTINHIRQVSGAVIKVKDTEPGATERVVEISGTAPQVSAAQGLISQCVVAK